MISGRLAYELRTEVDVGTNLTTKKQRDALEPRRNPYFVSLGKGRALGYRAGPGTWIARFMTRAGTYEYASLSERLEPGADYSKAKAAAEKWFEQMDGGARRAPTRGTVREALEGYLAHLRRQGREATATEAEARFRLIVWEDGLASLRLEDATRDDFEAWRDRLRPGRQPRSINRHVRGVQAALNLATDELGHVGNPAAWTLGALTDNTEEAGEGAVFLTLEQRERLIAKADKRLAAFLRGLLHTGARPSELAAATVADFDPHAGALVLRHKKGRPAKVRARAVTLSTEGADFFKAQAKGKTPAAPLVANDEGGHWRRHEWSREIRAAIVATNKRAKPRDRVPVDASAYSFRHARISELLQVYAVDPLTVAAQTGTSLAMMERYYFKFMPSALRAKLDGTKVHA